MQWRGLEKCWQLLGKGGEGDKGSGTRWGKFSCSWKNFLILENLSRKLKIIWEIDYPNVWQHVHLWTDYENPSFLNVIAFALVYIYISKNHAWWNKKDLAALSGRLMPIWGISVWMEKGIVWLVVERKWALGWEILQMRPIYSHIFTDSSIWSQRWK